MSTSTNWEAAIDYGYNARLRPWVVRRMHNGSWLILASQKSMWRDRRFASQAAAQKVADKLNAGPQP